MTEEKIENRTIGDKLISITAPAFNEVKCLEELCDRIKNSIEKITKSYEIVIVDNNSSDGSASLLRQLSADDPRIKYVRLSRNFGHFGGIIAGMEHCSGDIIITMDADLQHPPKVLPKLLDEWCKGYNIVGTRKRKSDRKRALDQNWFKDIGFSRLSIR